MQTPRALAALVCALASSHPQLPHAAQKQKKIPTHPQTIKPIAASKARSTNAHQAKNHDNNDEKRRSQITEHQSVLAPLRDRCALTSVSAIFYIVKKDVEESVVVVE